MFWSCKQLYNDDVVCQPVYTAPRMTDERAKLRRELQRYAAKRRQSLEAAEVALKEIADLLPSALEAGITKLEIQRLTGVSRPTIDRLLRGRP
jgi:hypothetical protein